MRRRWLGLGVAILAPVAHAGETRYWEIDTVQDFAEGTELRSIIVSKEGALRVGFETKVRRVASEEAIWSLARLADGTLILGTGSGKVYRQKGSDPAVVEFDTGQTLISDILAVGEDLYAATIPNGIVFRRRSGKWERWVQLPRSHLWALAPLPGGIAVACGSPAAVYRIELGGSFSPLFESHAEHAICLAAEAPERLVAGTMNPGHLIEIRGQRSSVLYDFGQNEVGSVAVRGETIYAAVNAKTGSLPPVYLQAISPRPTEKTGGPADKSGSRIYFQDPVSGRWEGVVRSEELGEDRVILELQLESGKIIGKILDETLDVEEEIEGTFEASSGKVLLRSKEGESLTLELKLSGMDRLEGTLSLRVKGKTISASVSLTRVKPQESPPAQAPGAGKEPPAPQSQPAPAAPVRAKVWRISPEHSEAIAEMPSFISDIRWGGDALFVALAATGQVARLYDDRGIEFFLQTSRGKILRLGMVGNSLHTVLLGGPAGWLTLSGTEARRGSYVTKLFDAGFRSRWGHLEIRGSGRIAARVRASNVATDALAAEWSEPLTAFPANIDLPTGRYLQVRIQLEEVDAVVHQIRIGYRNENQRPTLQQVKVVYQPVAPADGGAAQVTGSSPRLGMAHSPIKQISWVGQDPDGDPLQYRIFYRLGESGPWIPMFGAYSLAINQVPWNTESVPDGIYYLKVVADDQKANLKEEALTEEAIVGPLLVDNTRPSIEIVRKERGKVEGVARDAASAILRIEAQVDGGRWIEVAPADGVPDWPEERFVLDLAASKLKKGKHAVLLRAFDREMNIGSALVEVDVE